MQGQLLRTLKSYEGNLKSVINQQTMRLLVNEKPEKIYLFIVSFWSFFI